MNSTLHPIQALLELFRGPLASLRFADIDSAGLAELEAAVERAAAEAKQQEAKLAEVRLELALRREALLALAQRALAYARIYAESDPALAEQLHFIVLPRAAKPRKVSSVNSATHDRADGTHQSTSAATFQSSRGAGDVALDASPEPSGEADAVGAGAVERVVSSIESEAIESEAIESEAIESEAIESEAAPAPRRGKGREKGRALSASR